LVALDSFLTPSITILPVYIAAWLRNLVQLKIIFPIAV
jgi:hypothetical protein